MVSNPSSDNPGKELPKKKIIELSQKGDSAASIARQLKLYPDRVRRFLQKLGEQKVVNSQAFERHSQNIYGATQTASDMLIELTLEPMAEALTHFKQKYHRFAHLNTWLDVTSEDIKNRVIEQMQLMASGVIVEFSCDCPTCQALAKELGRDRVVVSQAFEKHSQNICGTTQRASLILMGFTTGRMAEATAHFTTEYHRFAHLNTWLDVTSEDIKNRVIEQMQLMANKQILSFCRKCSTCQAQRKALMKPRLL